MHTNDAEGFKKYLNILNKTFATATSRSGLRVYYSPVIIARFVAILYYYDQCINGYHTIPDINLVDSAFADKMIQTLKEHEESATMDSDDEEDVTIPTLQGSKNWVDFRDKFVLELSMIKSKRGFPLDYLINTTARAVTSARTPYLEVGRVNIEDDDYYCSNAVLFGPHFKADNKKLWSKIKNLLLGTDSYNHVSMHDTKKDGCSAWFSLTKVYEGPDFKDRLRELAFSKLSSTFYKGETARFDFEKYVNIHKSAHCMLQEAEYNAGKGMDDDTKIQHLKSGIKVEAGIEYALTQMRAQPTNYATFTQVTTFLSGEIQHKQLRCAQIKGSTPGRVVSKVEKETPSKIVEGKKVFGKRYSCNNFHALTKAQRKAVIEMQRAARSKAGQGRGRGQKRSRNGGNGNRTASSVKKIPNEDLTVVAEAVIAGITKANKDNEGLSVMTENADSGKPLKGKDTADAGSVGDFIAKHPQSKKPRN